VVLIAGKATRPASTSGRPWIGFDDREVAAQALARRAAPRMRRMSGVLTAADPEGRVIPLFRGAGGRDHRRRGSAMFPIPAAVLRGPVVIDSREAEPGSLFVALPGTRADGHDFAAAAVAAGAGAVLAGPPGRRAPLVVADVPAALAAWLRPWRGGCPA